MVSNDYIAEVLSTLADFRGCYSSDDLLNLSKVKKGVHRYVINLDIAKGPGTHFVYLQLENLLASYFDSFGNKISNKYILKFLFINGYKTYKYNPLQVQNIFSDKCGFYCISAAIHTSEGMTLQNFIDLFSTDTSNNDKICIESIISTSNR